MERPIFGLLTRVAKRMSLHMPAGQGKAPFGEVNPYELDTTELDVTDDLYCPSGTIAQAQQLVAKSAGVNQTIMLHGGSTAGIHAMLLYAAKRGETVILPRNIHIAAIHICATAGIIPAFAAPSYTETGRPYTTLESYIRAMDENLAARAVVIVRPDYYGALVELDGIAKEAHKRGMLVLCDEAHGAYFNWDKQAKNAGACGADLFVQSAHKTLPALGAGAWLHAMEGVDIVRLRRMLRMVQTSSPSFVNMLSLDDARAWMDEHGEAACEKLRTGIAAFHEKVSCLGYRNAQDEAGMDYDPLRLVLYAPQGGYQLGEELAEQGIDVELADDCRIACILSLIDGIERLRILYDALMRIEIKCENDSKPYYHDIVKLPIPPRELPLSIAAFADAQSVPLDAAIGRISAVQVGFYPPGIALLTAGERITEELVNCLRAADISHIFGLDDDGTLYCVQKEVLPYDYFSL